MSKYTLILHFKNKHIGLERLNELAGDLAKISGLNVLCFDNEVDVTVVEINEEKGETNEINH